MCISVYVYIYIYVYIQIYIYMYICKYTTAQPRRSAPRIKRQCARYI